MSEEHVRIENPDPEESLQRRCRCGRAMVPVTDGAGTPWAVCETIADEIEGSSTAT